MQTRKPSKYEDSTKAEAEAEVRKDRRDWKTNLANIRKNIKTSFDATVDSIVQAVLGDTSTMSVTPQKMEKTQPSSSVVRQPRSGNIPQTASQSADP